MQPAIERTAEIPGRPLLATQMTLRDYFAIHVPEGSLQGKNTDTYEDEAKQRYLFADAMMKARNAT